MHLNLFPKKPELLFNTLTNQTILVQNLRTGPNKNLKPCLPTRQAHAKKPHAPANLKPETSNKKTSNPKPQTK
jgi:hypothetical protein